jgi:glutamate-5-semialdehyde dehydrogenase
MLASKAMLNIVRLVGLVNKRTLLDDELLLERQTCPIGVLLIIFEARPEVIANIASLAIKSGNAAILKGGKESSESFKAISKVISIALRSTKVPQDCLQLVMTHDVIGQLLKLDQCIDLVIPRGGNKLVRMVKDNTAIPVLGHADGLCTLYLTADAPRDMAVRVIVDSKTTYPAACNSLETLLVDEAALTATLPTVAEALLSKGVSLLCDEASRAALNTSLDKHSAIQLQRASEEDFRTEFLDLKLAIKTIPRCASPEEAVDIAISHANEYSSHHTDSILTMNKSLAERYQNGVDSSCVFWNTSTRMSDGQRFGFGTEVGISTNKIHSRGPVGLEGLTIYKWKINGNGQVTAEYGSQGKQWKHQDLPLDDERIARTNEELDVLRKFRSQNLNGHAS